MMDISIHALLAESDCFDSFHYDGTTLISIHALLAESDAKRWNSTERPVISIHALLAESDLILHMAHLMELLFLSTLSLRRATVFFA